jgi:hypothetical protein
MKQIARRAFGSSNDNNTFTETLVHELRKQLNRATTISAERMNEMVRLKEELTHLQQSADNKHHTGVADQTRSLSLQVHIIR